MRRSERHCALFLTCTVPRLPDHPLVTNEVLAVAKSLSDYCKHSFLENVSKKIGVRYPVHVTVSTQITRSDERLLAIVVCIKADMHTTALYKKHVYLYYTENGSLPVAAKKLTDAKTRHPLFVKDTACTDAVTGEEYPLKSKYQKEK